MSKVVMRPKTKFQTFRWVINWWSRFFENDRLMLNNYRFKKKIDRIENLWQKKRLSINQKKKQKNKKKQNYYINILTCVHNRPT